MELKVPPLDTRCRPTSHLTSYRDLLPPKGQILTSNQVRLESRRLGYPDRESFRTQPSADSNTKRQIAPTRNSVLQESVSVCREGLYSRQSIVQHDSFEESIVINKPLGEDEVFRPKALEDVARMYRPKRAKTEANEYYSAKEVP